MIVELALSAGTTAGFAVIALFEHFAQNPRDASAKHDARSNRPVKILLGSCVLIGNIIIWIPAMFGF